MQRTVLWCACRHAMCIADYTSICIKSVTHTSFYQFIQAVVCDLIYPTIC